MGTPPTKKPSTETPKYGGFRDSGEREGKVEIATIGPEQLAAIIRQRKAAMARQKP